MVVVARVPTVIWQGVWTGEEGFSLGRPLMEEPAFLGYSHSLEKTTHV